MTRNTVVDTARGLAELDLPEYDDVSNAPAQDGTLVYVTGDGATTPEGAYLRTAGSYAEIGSGSGLTATEHDNRDHGAALDSTFGSAAQDEVIKYDGSNWIVSPRTEVLIARKNQDQSVTSTGSWVTVGWDTNTYTGLSGFSTANNNWSPPRDGVYRIFAQINVNFGTSANTSARIQETTGSTTLSEVEMGAGSGSDVTHTLLTIETLTAGDTVEVQAQTDQTGGTSDFGGESGQAEFIAEYLGP